MGFDYSNLANTAIAQIVDKGRDVTYKAFNKGVYDPATDSVSGDSFAGTTIKAVITNISQSRIDQSDVKRGDRSALITGDLITPNKKDKIVDGADTYQIVNIEIVHTGDTVIMYRLQVRK